MASMAYLVSVVQLVQVPVQVMVPVFHDCYVMNGKVHCLLHFGKESV